MNGLEGFTDTFQRLAERYPGFIEELGKLVWTLTENPQYCAEDLEPFIDLITKSLAFAWSANEAERTAAENKPSNA